MNMCLLTSEDIHAYVKSKVPTNRALHYYYLALSLESMFSSRSSPLSSVLKSLNQLIEEFEFFISGSAMQYTRLMMARTIPCPFPQIIQNDADDDQAMKASIHKFQNTAVYEFLKVPAINFELDYVEVVIALCDTLTRLYDQLSNEDNYSNPTAYELLVRTDSKLKHHFVDLVSKELTLLSTERAQKQVEKLRSALVLTG